MGQVYDTLDGDRIEILEETGPFSFLGESVVTKERLGYWADGKNRNNQPLKSLIIWRKPLVVRPT